jgi:hypothetical protein
MNMTTDNDHLIDRSLIEQWQRDHASLEARCAAAERELADAQVAFEAAKDAADEAVVHASQDAVEKEDALTRAITVLRVARRVHDSAGQAVQTSAGERRAAAHRAAHAPVARAAFVRRVAAVRRAEGLMADLKSTAQEFADADKALSSIHTNVGPFPSELGIGARLLDERGVPAFSAASHEARLRGCGIDPDTGAAPWL